VWFFFVFELLVVVEEEMEWLMKMMNLVVFLCFVRGKLSVGFIVVSFFIFTAVEWKGRCLFLCFYYEMD